MIGFAIVFVGGMVAETFLGWGKQIRGWAEKQLNK